MFHPPTYVGLKYLCVHTSVYKHEQLNITSYELPSAEKIILLSHKVPKLAALSFSAASQISDNLIFKCDRIVAVSSVCTNWAINFEINKINILSFVIQFCRYVDICCNYVLSTLLFDKSFPSYQLTRGRHLVVAIMYVLRIDCK